MSLHLKVQLALREKKNVGREGKKKEIISCNGIMQSMLECGGLVGGGAVWCGRLGGWGPVAAGGGRVGVWLGQGIVGRRRGGLDK